MCLFAPFIYCIYPSKYLYINIPTHLLVHLPIFPSSHLHVPIHPSPLGSHLSIQLLIKPPTHYLPTHLPFHLPSLTHCTVPTYHALPNYLPLKPTYLLTHLPTYLQTQSPTYPSVYPLPSIKSTINLSIHPLTYSIYQYPYPSTT